MIYKIKVYYFMRQMIQINLFKSKNSIVTKDWVLKMREIKMREI